MRKGPEIEDGIKSIIRDELALSPLLSVQKMRVQLFMNGYKTSNGPLDWHYVSKLMSKVRCANVASLKTHTRVQRLVALRERHRILTEKLKDIVECKPIISFDKPIYPTQGDRIAAANLIMKWDLAMLFVEDTANQPNLKHKTTALIVDSKQEREAGKWLPISAKILRNQV